MKDWQDLSWSGISSSNLRDTGAQGILCEGIGDGGGDGEHWGSKWFSDIPAMAGPKSSKSLLALLGSVLWLLYTGPQLWIHQIVIIIDGICVCTTLQAEFPY